MAVTSSTFAVQANGTNPGFFTSITVDNVLNVVHNDTFLTNAAGVGNGRFQSDYTINAATGALTVRDVVVTLPTGGIVATYYGDEATNPTVLAQPKNANGTPFVPANPGYAITQYTYSSPGVLTQILAYDYTGKVFVGI